MKRLLLIVCVLLISIFHGTSRTTKQPYTDKISSPSSKTEITKTDSLISIDKKNIIEKVAHEVFSNYYDSILSLKKNFNTTSIMIYIDTYIKKQNDSIEKRISSKAYIHRFAKTEKLWIATDFSEVAAAIKVRTLDRIKEISAAVVIEAPNILNTITNDKEELLEKKVKEEIKE
jgi:hypothetical protein